MITNHWMRQARMRDIRARGEIGFFTWEVDDQGIDWHIVPIPGRFSWSDDLTVALDETRPIYGFEVFLDNKPIYKEIFPYAVTNGLGTTLSISLNINRICP